MKLYLRGGVSSPYVHFQRQLEEQCSRRSQPKPWNIIVTIKVLSYMLRIYVFLLVIELFLLLLFITIIISGILLPPVLLDLDG